MDATCSPSLRALVHNRVLHSSKYAPRSLSHEVGSHNSQRKAFIHNLYFPQYFNLCNCGSYLIEIKHEAEIIKCVEEKKFGFQELLE